MRPVLIVVGGFLGVGKTTLLLAAARILQQGGRRAAIITNDQAGDLVDTAWVSGQGVPADEVTGGCFCCRFSDFIEATEQVREMVRPDVLFAEPVGSCTDISATVLQPLQTYYRQRFRLAPFTVLLDPGQIAHIRSDEHMTFLFENQIGEADLLCYTKSDLHAEFPELPGHRAPRRLSARTGAGVAAWLDEMLMSGEAAAGTKVLAIDYERYAGAEAALGWLNCRCELSLAAPLSPAMVCGPLLDELDRRLTAASAAVAHLKVLDRCGSGYLKASLTANGDEPRIEGALDASPAAHHELLVNLRASADPELLRSIVSESLAGIPGRLTMHNLQAFRPAAPRPQYRLPARAD